MDGRAARERVSSAPRFRCHSRPGAALGAAPKYLPVGTEFRQAGCRLRLHSGNGWQDLMLMRQLRGPDVLCDLLVQGEDGVLQKRHMLQREPNPLALHRAHSMLFDGRLNLDCVAGAELADLGLRFPIGRATSAGPGLSTGLVPPLRRTSLRPDAAI